MGGGKGTRLYPLTAERSKPAVPFGGKYRLVDIPLSNSIAADFKKIYVLTQFNSASLHLHIGNTYIFDSFTNGFVEILAADIKLRAGSARASNKRDKVCEISRRFRCVAPCSCMVETNEHNQAAQHRRS